MFMELIKDVMLIELWCKETKKYAVNQNLSVCQWYAFLFILCFSLIYNV